MSIGLQPRTPSAARQLAKLQRPVQRRIAHAIERLAADPPGRDSVELTGAEYVWRIRVGDYRVLYQIDKDRLVVLVVAVGHRASVYRR